MADMDAWRAMSQGTRTLEPLAKERSVPVGVGQMADCKEMMEDEDAQMRELAAQSARSRNRRRRWKRRFAYCCCPKIQRRAQRRHGIRAGTGGEEAALFGANLYCMFSRYAERHGFTVEPMNLNLTELGGVKRRRSSSSTARAPTPA